MQGLKKLVAIICTSVWMVSATYAQFAPGADHPGTTALAADSSIFINWATDIAIQIGPQNIVEPELGLADFGFPQSALGPADNNVVSLGDGGTATLSFEHPIRDGEGWDFAVFENGFDSPLGYFLELGLVEVSSDGIHFFQFPATSLTDTIVQVNSFGTLDPTRIDGLAGKYETGFGVPFDLSDIPDQANFDRNYVIQVRIIDVVGTIDPAFSTRDAAGYPINDPWPTPFPSGGFDLDAVGVIHQSIETSTSGSTVSPSFFRLSPNPIQEGAKLKIESDEAMERLLVFNSLGQLVWQGTAPNKLLALDSPLAKGTYFLLAQMKSGKQQIQTFVVF